MKTHNVVIKGTGYCLPNNNIDNLEIVSRLNSTVEFIENRTGVLTRKHVDTNQSLSDITVPAMASALADANLQASDIDMLIVNTLSPDHHDPSQACLLQSKFKFNHIPVFDIRAQCTGLIYGLDIAQQYIQSGKHKNIMIVCGEVLSKRMDYSDDGRNLSILLGDGAGAVIVGREEKEDNKGFKDIIIQADGDYFKLLWTEGPGSANPEFTQGTPYFRMNGKDMFQHALSSFVKISKDILEKHNLTIDDIDLVIPHQPNMRILDKVIEELNLPLDKIVLNVEALGNMASGSLPVTLAMAREEGKLKEGGLYLIVGYGSGATWGAALYQN
ncbi:beta-ketoacyl-ACP synthase 3 [Pseudofulvibacter geojedonensis]|uniref:Beta-ketoacyl-ACP synthase 3 n=1 Tax=Pseudofulvibacter geojedonensis TaxID=1123758 RepID=A0ABW3HZW1_9FLAO